MSSTHRFSAPYIFEPKNELERLIREFHDGRIDEKIFYKRLIDRTVYVAADDLDAAEGMGPLSPVILGRDDKEYVAVFSMMDRVETLVREGGGSVQMIFRQLLGRVPGGLGIVINPGYEVFVEIPPERIGGLREIVRERESRIVKQK